MFERRAFARGWRFRPGFALRQVMGNIANEQGRPIAERPIITASAPDCASIDAASARLAQSPFATTGIETAFLTAPIAAQFAWTRRMTAGTAVNGQHGDPFGFRQPAEFRALTD